MKKGEIYSMVIMATLSLYTNALKEDFGINERGTTPSECGHKDFFNQHFGPQPPETASFVDYLLQSGDIESLSKINPAYLRMDGRYDTYLNLLRDQRSASGSSCVQE